MENTETVEYRKFKGLEKTNICAVCGANTVTVWNSRTSIYELVCGHDPTHKGYRRRPTDTDLVKRGALDTIKSPGTQADIERFVESHPGAISLAPTQDVATRQTLSQQQLVALGAFAKSVGLSAFLGHVCLYFGKPYVTIDGYYYWKNEHRCTFMVSCMPMTAAERKSYLVTEGSHAFIARAITAGGDELARGIGIITPEEMNEKSRKNPESFAAPVVHDKPQRMAEKRAEWQLLRKMIPIGGDFSSPPPLPPDLNYLSEVETNKIESQPETKPRESSPKVGPESSEIPELWS